MQIAVGAAVVVAACVLVYGQVMDFQFVNWDDDLHVVQNQAVKAPADVPLKDHLLTPYLGYPVPVTVASYMVDHAVAGLNPQWFHIVNLLIHAGAALAVFWCVWRLGYGTLAALACAMFFALHPLGGESVSWISGRKDLLATLFSVLAVAVYLGVRDEDRSVRSRLPVAGLAMLAALSKPSALLVPILFLVLDLRRPLSSGPVSASGRGRLVWPVVLLCNAALAVVAFKLESGMGALDGAGISGGNFVLRVLAGAGWHARILLWPFDLMPKYIDPAGGPSIFVLVTGALVIVMLLSLLVLTWIRRSPAFVGLALAALAYLPQSGLVPLSRQYANSYAYFCLAGLVIAAASLSVPVAGVRRPVRMVSYVAISVILAGLGLAAHVQARVYRDGVTLWSTVYRAYPDSPQVCRNLGNAFMFMSRNEPEAAAHLYEHCIQTLGNRQYFQKNLAIAKFRAGRISEAAQLFNEYRQTVGPDPVVDKYLNMIRQAQSPQ